MAIAIKEINTEIIPQELRDRRSWVTWRVEDQGGRAVKPPFNPRTGRRASCSDPATWGTFDEACMAFEEGHYDGVGFQLTPPFVGVDLDGCRNPETGSIDDGARATIKQLDSYTEVSPSGTGIHILVKGNLPPGGRRTKGVELYDGNRYFTFTGLHVAGTPLSVEERTAEVEALHGRVFGRQRSALSPPQVQIGPRKPHASMSLSDRDLIERIKRSGNGDRFERLWRGDWRSVRRNWTHSDADYDLCRTYLAFWTGRDAERMDSLFRQSGLFRAKWDERRGRQTYGEITIDKAIRNQTYTAPPSAFSGGDE